MIKYIKFFKYLFEFIVIIVFFFIFKILGLKISSFISRRIFNIFGSIFRSKKVVSKNLKIAFPKITENKHSILIAEGKLVKLLQVELQNK